MAKLRNVKNFKQQDVHQAKTGHQYTEDYKMLDRMLPHIFPNETTIKEIIKRHKDKKDTYRKDEYILECLPLHIRDEKWLLTYLKRHIEEQGLSLDINVNCLESYVKTPNFKKACENFSSRFIKAKLKNMMVSTRAKHETIVDAGFPDFSHRIDCDQFFRQHALSYFILKGFDRHTVETNLEKNADIWRKPTMRQAFENTCNLEILVYDFPQDNLHKKEFYRKKHAYRKLWIKYREYEYYQKYKKLIDELGLATDSMKMSSQDASQVLYDLGIAEKNMTNVLMQGKNKDKEI